jgi:hypothetical protein
LNDADFGPHPPIPSPMEEKESIFLISLQADYIPLSF